MARLRRIFDGTGPFSGFAVACWLVGLVWLLTILMSPNGFDWWLNVHSVQGQDINGLVYYSVNGVRYTLNDPHSLPGDKPGVRTVYYVPSQPADGTLHNTANEVLDWGLTVGPGAIGLGVLVTGFAKRRSRLTRMGAADRPDTFGSGIPAETIRAILSREHNSRA